jgi:hypothetical protein
MSDTHFYPLPSDSPIDLVGSILLAARMFHLGASRVTRSLQRIVGSSTLGCQPVFAYRTNKNCLCRDKGRVVRPVIALASDHFNQICLRIVGP